MLNFVKSPVTGQFEAGFNAKLVSISKTILTNSNGTQYRIAQIELPNGKEVSGRMYEANYKHGAPIGQSVLCRATKYNDSTGNEMLDITVSHLTGAERATLADLEDAFGASKQSTPRVVAANPILD